MSLPFVGFLAACAVLALLAARWLGKPKRQEPILYGQWYIDALADQEVLL